MPLITKADFAGVIPVTVNLPTDAANMYINQAEKFDLATILPTGLYDAVVTYKGNVSYPELNALFTGYLKELLLHQTYMRMFPQHGVNVTQYGVRVNNEDTSNEVSSSQRAEIIRNENSIINILTARLMTYGDAAEWTFDGTKYEFDTCNPNKPQKFKFFAL